MCVRFRVFLLTVNRSRIEYGPFLRRLPSFDERKNCWRFGSFVYLNCSRYTYVANKNLIIIFVQRKHHKSIHRIPYSLRTTKENHICRWDEELSVNGATIPRHSCVHISLNDIYIYFFHHSVVARSSVSSVRIFVSKVLLLCAQCVQFRHRHNHSNLHAWKITELCVNRLRINVP